MYDPAEEIGDEEEAQQKQEFSFSTIKNINDSTGGKLKKGEVFHILITNIFDEEQRVIEEHLPAFIGKMVANKVFKERDYTEGIARIIAIFPDLSLDFPNLHRYLIDLVIYPLVAAKGIKNVTSLIITMNRKDVITEEEEDDEDDIQIDSTDLWFKFVALLVIRDSQKQKKPI
mmetsp:Transcript_13293/g.22561  ORF Transcript_13293/g.22561 Transcript_13293/m.22561 type:complete len:173 (+) Transcript_13293:2541-3059(+)